MWKSRIQLTAAVCGCLALVGCAQNLEGTSFDEQWRLVSRIDDQTFLFGADGGVQGRREAWIGEEYPVFVGGAADSANCPIFPLRTTPDELEDFVSQLQRPDWIDASKVASAGTRFDRMAHQCARSFPAEEYWFESLDEVQQFVTRSNAQSVQDAEWLPIYSFSEFTRFARLEDAGSEMGWSIAVNPVEYSGAYASFYLADCDAELLVDVKSVHFSANVVQGEISSHQLRYRAPSLDPGDAELLGWLCGSSDLGPDSTLEHRVFTFN